jgi:hypothetical protein
MALPFFFFNQIHFHLNCPGTHSPEFLIILLKYFKFQPIYWKTPSVPKGDELLLTIQPKRVFIMKKNIALLSIIFFLGIWCLPAHAAERVVINNELNGELRFPGYQILNDDGSTTLLGTTDIGDAIGDLPGRWAIIMQATYPEGETSGDVVGFFAVGDNGQDAVYGFIAGIMDPSAGTFSFVATVAGGIGIYEGFTGFGTLLGDLVDAGQLIEGRLDFVLNKTATTKFRTEPINRAHGNPALLLLDK